MSTPIIDLILRIRPFRGRGPSSGLRHSMSTRRCTILSMVIYSEDEKQCVLESSYEYFLLLHSFTANSSMASSDACADFSLGVHSVATASDLK